MWLSLHSMQNLQMLLHILLHLFYYHILSSDHWVLLLAQYFMKCVLSNLDVNKKTPIQVTQNNIYDIV